MAALRIGIAGAGIGGLAAATLLSRDGHSVAVFDQFDTPRPVGSGLVIQPVGLDVLDRIGAGDDARRAGAPIWRMLGLEAATRRRVLDVWYDRRKSGRFGLGIHRATLFDLLYKAAIAAGATIHPAHRVAGFSNHGQPELHFCSGDSAPFDLVIDAAGAGSALSPLAGRSLPYGAVWGTVNWPDGSTIPRDQLTQRYRRAAHMIGALPIGRLPGEDHQKAAIFWSLPAGEYETWRTTPLAEWKAQVTALWPGFAPFVEQITDHEQMTMARYAHGTLARPFAPGLAHIGDAAHCASPQLGQGANMALLDAFAMAMALRLARGDAALALYARARRRHVGAYQAMSHIFTPLYQSDSRLLPLLRDWLMAPASQVPPIPRILSRLVCGDLMSPYGRYRRDFENSPASAR